MTTTIRIALIALLTFAICGVTLADQATAGAEEKSLSVYTYQFKHKEAEKAASAIKKLVSSEGTVSIQPSTNSVVITDRADNLRNITAALQRYDSPPQPVQLVVRLVTAGRVDGAAARVPEALKDVASKLAMLRYNAFESLGSANVSGHEGEPGIIELGAGYRADFKFG